MRGQLTVTALVVALCYATHAQASWIMLDDFSGQGPIGGSNWYQTTPIQNFQMSDGRLSAIGKAMAVHQQFPQPGDPQRFRFEIYSGEPGVGTRDDSVQKVSAILGAKNAMTYYEIRLLADNLVSTDFYRMHLYSVVGGVATRDLTIGFGTSFDAARMEASLNGSTVTVTVQPIDRLTGLAVGAPVMCGYGGVPAIIADNPDTSQVGLAAQGRYVQIDNFEGFIAPEATTLFAITLACIPLLRTRVRKIESN